jgi:hypothetical protein
MIKPTQLRLTRDSCIQSQSSVFTMTIVVKVLLGISTFLHGNSVDAFHHPSHSTKNCLLLPRTIHTILPLHYSNNDPIPHLHDIQTNTNTEKNNYPSEMAATPPRVIKHKNRQKIKRNNKKHLSKQRLETGPCTADELALHVSSQYVSGPGGILKQIDARRKREEASKRVFCDKEQEEYLKKLDRHPVLVLNADYQVS